MIDMRVVKVWSILIVTERISTRSHESEANFNPILYIYLLDTVFTNLLYLQT